MGTKPHTSFEWYAWFKIARTELGDDECIERRSTLTTPETIAKSQQCICENCCQTIHNIVTELGISYGTCYRILSEELGMHHIAAKFVPRPLKTDQKQHRVEVISELKSFV